MKKCSISRSRSYGPTKKVAFALSFTAAGVVATLPVVWAYQKIHLGLGREAAQVTLALQVFVLLVMITVGLGLGYLTDWAIRQRKSVFYSPQEGSITEVLVRLWGYEINCQEHVQSDIVPEVSVLQNSGEILEIINRPRRRGRKPTFPLEAWLPIAAKWENRDPIRDAFTLEDLIRESLGENLDGSPIVSAQSYYNTWRERALEELQLRAQARHAAGAPIQDGRQPKG